MKKSGLMLMAVTFMLSGCFMFKKDNNNNNNDNNKKAVSDEELRVTPDLKEDYNNPINLPVAHGSTEAADPFVYRFNGKYYMYMTTGGGFVRCYVSSDLLTWAPSTNGPDTGVCYKATSQDNIGNTPFAPEVIYYNGYFYMVTSPSGNGHFILVSESPEGPFRDITGNFGKSIDGSFFIDEDEQPYLFTAGSNAILGYKLSQLSPDGISFEKSDGNDWTMSYSESHLGAWNEGPYMLKRFGAYYMTQTGTHYLSPGYRVNYIYAPKGSDVSKSSSFTHINNLNTLVSTETDFHALGHSCTVLGPDMDSYYIAYHSMRGASTQRFYNLNRLSFNGGNMTINEYGEMFNQAPSLPEYSVENESEMDKNGSVYLSDKEHESDSFTAEFNTVGEGKMYFAYKSESDHAYLEFKDNQITLAKVSGGKFALIKKITLANEYDTDVIHTFRINYGEGKAAIYFDAIEKAYDIDCSFEKGKIGVSDSFDEICYCAFSNVGGGTSDKVEYNSKKILANAFNDHLSILNGTNSGITYSEKGAERIIDNGLMTLSEKGDRATYLMRQNISETYNIALRMPSNMMGKKLGIRLNDGEVKEVSIPNNTPKIKNGDVYLNITKLDINEGEYNFSIVNIGDEISFYEIDFEQVYENPSFDLDLGADFNSENDFIIRNNLTYSNKSIVTSSDIDAFGFLSRAKFNNPKASVSFKLTGTFEAIGFISLLANVNNYNNSTSLEANPGYMQQGYMLMVEQDAIKLCYVDFNFINVVATYKEGLKNNVLYDLSMEIENNNIICYLDGEEIINVYANVGRLSGQVGVLAYKVDSLISHFSAF